MAKPVPFLEAVGPALTGSRLGPKVGGDMMYLYMSITEAFRGHGSLLYF